MGNIQYLNQTLNILQDIEINFMMLRGFDEYEQCSKDNDIDILIHPKDIDKAQAELIDTLGYRVVIQNSQMLYDAKPKRHFYQDKYDLHLDVVEGLYYCSMNDKNLFVPIAEPLQKTIWEDKVKVERPWHFQPSNEDLLVHLCCHCLFDKGKIPKKYISQIRLLYEECNTKLLRTKMEWAFYKMGLPMLDVIGSGNITDLPRAYTQSASY
ncbi:uncharacterized protein METZ01_LOCUS109888 [marine metagenome]|uniref:Nucleotidyltransferase family protein n=1 Tax=marine metagenome TaxID=408172 RepID=A0A381WX03_9ZZZZ